MTSAHKLCLAPPHCNDGKPASVGNVEALLAEWFEAPVVLTSSGRSALLLAFQDLGLSRYKSRIAMSPKTAACVFDAVIRVAFPVDAASSDAASADAALVIHQYGHLQKGKPAGPIVEDICHNFFASAATGARDWLGEYAAFSLPKFMTTAGMVGGLILRSDAVANRVRALRDEFASRDPEDLRHSRAEWRRGRTGQAQAQLAALLNAKPDPHAIGTFPETLQGVRSFAKIRVTNTEALLAELSQSALPGDWLGMCAASLPFAIPVFGTRQDLALLAHRLDPLLDDTSIYAVDLNRSHKNPDFQPALLLPAHNLISATQLRAICRELRLWTQR